MNILFGVTGGISIYKTLNIIRILKKQEHSVRVIMTESATKFINPILFKTICADEVYTQDFDISAPLAHIQTPDWADVFVIAPASANTIAKIANGIGDNLLTSAMLAFDKRRVIFPAMNVKMYENRITQDNIRKLLHYGFEVYEPSMGDLACGYSGKGRLPDEEYIAGIIDKDPDKPLKGQRYIVSAGATLEKIDPVRYISNFSSGKMGIAIARTLFYYGADVLLICGFVNIGIPSYIKSIRVSDTREMMNAILKNLADYDGVYMAAAPADFRAKDISKSKIKKTDSEITVNLTQNPDILKEVRSKFKDKTLVGFALETDNGLSNAQKKLKDKGLDFIVLNEISNDFSPLGSDTNSITVISKDGKTLELKNEIKDKVAHFIVENTAIQGLK
jgi:phosphopantothenoylcysteine decarboxylase/phosphopantothenate--cysteine ligase